MEAISVLEEKIARLISSKKQDVKIIAGLSEENSQLKEENSKLGSSIEKLESSILAKNKSKSELDKIQENTKAMVDELIQNIDVLLEEKSQL